MSIPKQFLILISISASCYGGTMPPFPLSQVRLGARVFKESMEVNRRVLDGIGADRALYCFRFNTGLNTRGAKPMESWATPEPGSSKAITSPPSR